MCRRRRQLGAQLPERLGSFGARRAPCHFAERHGGLPVHARHLALGRGGAGGEAEQQRHSRQGMEKAR
jgi:hypothetical protein